MRKLASSLTVSRNKKLPRAQPSCGSPFNGPASPRPPSSLSGDIGWQECKHRFLRGQRAGDRAAEWAKPPSIRNTPEMQTTALRQGGWLTGDAWYIVMLPVDLNSCVNSSSEIRVLGCVFPSHGSLGPQCEFTQRCIHLLAAYSIVLFLGHTSFFITNK